MTHGGDIARQQASYRRGLVLGLTVAESLLLILFALLLALGWVLVKRDREGLGQRGPFGSRSIRLLKSYRHRGAEMDDRSWRA